MKDEIDGIEKYCECVKFANAISAELRIKIGYIGVYYKHPEGNMKRSIAKGAEIKLFSTNSITELHIFLSGIVCSRTIMSCSS